MGAFSKEDMGGGLSATPVSEFYMPSRKKKHKTKKVGGAMKVTPVREQDFTEMGATPVSGQDFGVPKKRGKRKLSSVRVVATPKHKKKVRKEPGMWDFPRSPRF